MGAQATWAIHASEFGETLHSFRGHSGMVETSPDWALAKDDISSGTLGDNFGFGKADNERHNVDVLQVIHGDRKDARELHLKTMKIVAGFCLVVMYYLFIETNTWKELSACAMGLAFLKYV